MSQQYPSRGKTRLRCTSAGHVTGRLLLSFLALSSTALAHSLANGVDEQAVLPLPPSGPVLTPEPPSPAEHVFTLRHIYHHGTHLYPDLHRRTDFHQRDADLWLAAADGFDREKLPTLHAKSQAGSIHRLVDRRPSVVDPMVAEARENGYLNVLSMGAWTMDAVPMPNMTDKATIVSLAYMASNAYVETPDEADWDDVGAPFNRSADFGWEGDGLRGHVFADAANTTVVIGLKGTSLAVFDGEGTTTNDKENDNLFFSCCCAQQGQWTYRQVCDCATGTYACNNTCVRRALQQENRYYRAARELFANVSAAYPDAHVWLTGHSLGGAVSSFVGLTYGVPVVTFEAVPEALAAGRLGLPVPPDADPRFPQTRDYTGTYHVGHTADPIYIGTCNGATASCTYAGYALESACHTGYECVYDVVADKGWRVGIGTHKIRSVIRDILLPYDDVPACTFTPECRDCASWNMFESNGTETTTTAPTSAPTSATRTRTQTCETPGWWGCLDETTTTAVTTTRAHETTTVTTTCMTPGRFWGCRDETTTAALSTSTLPVTTPPRTSASTTTTSTTCATPGRVWGCWDKSTDADAPTHAITMPPAVSTTAVSSPIETEPRPSKQRCRHRSWFGFCREWDGDNEL